MFDNHGKSLRVEALSITTCSEPEGFFSTVCSQESNLNDMLVQILLRTQLNPYVKTYLGPSPP